MTHYVPVPLEDVSRPLPRAGSAIECSLLKKLPASTLAGFAAQDGEPAYIHRICRYFVKGMTFLPHFRDASVLAFDEIVE